MNIYIDFDDCLCETAKHFSLLVKDMFGKDVPYEDMHYFDLKRTFDLTDEQYEKMMLEGHTAEVLLSSGPASLPGKPAEASAGILLPK